MGQEDRRLTFSKIVFFTLVVLGLPILASVTRSLMRGKPDIAWKTLRVYLVPVAIYVTLLLAFTLATPVKVLATGDVQYLDDWSIGVASVRREPHDLDEDYEIDFRLGNRSDKPLQGEKLAVYLLTEDGTRYNAAPEPSTPPFDVVVDPGKSVLTTRKFVLPTNQNRIELVEAREGFRLSWFLIGRSPFDSHTVIQLQ